MNENVEAWKLSVFFSARLLPIQLQIKALLLPCELMKEMGKIILYTAAQQIWWQQMVTPFNLLRQRSKSSCVICNELINVYSQRHTF